MRNAVLARANRHKPQVTRGVRALLAKNPAMGGFLEHCHYRHYSAKSVILRAGDVAGELYFLLRGSVAVLVEDEASDQEIVLAYLNEGDFVGELGLFEDRPERTASVCTRTPCEVAEISYERLRTLMLEYPEIVHVMYAQVARRLLEANRKVQDLAFTDVTGRIAHALLKLCKQPDAMTHPDGTQVRITRQELSRIVGCSREMVTRVLKKLVQQGLIDVAGRTIVVHGTHGCI